MGFVFLGYPVYAGHSKLIRAWIASLLGSLMQAEQFI